MTEHERYFRALMVQCELCAHPVVFLWRLKHLTTAAFNTSDTAAFNT